jgi:Flp pilus assembly protein TadD
MSIVLDALRKATASEKIGSPEKKRKEFFLLRLPFSPFSPWFRGLMGGMILVVLVIAALFLKPVGLQKQVDGGIQTPLAVSPPTQRPKQSDDLHQEGMKRYHEGEYEAALLIFREIASRQSRSPEAHSDLGLLLKKTGNITEAKREYQWALELDSGYVEAMNNLAVLYGEEGKKDEAKHLFLQAIRLRPDYGSAHLNFAVHLEQEGKTGEATEHYRRYLSLVPPEDAAAVRIRNHLQFLDRT